MKKSILSLLFLFVGIVSLSAQITRIQADSIVLTHLQNAVTQPYLLYVNANTPSAEGIVITTSNEETFHTKYACWAYYVKENESSQCRYLFVKENNGNLLEIIAHNDNGQSDLTQWMAVTSGVDDNEEFPVLSIFPNPTTGIFIIQMDEKAGAQLKEIEIFNMSGTFVFSLPHPIVHKGTVNMDISHLPVGAYFLRIHLEKEIVTRKIVKFE